MARTLRHQSNIPLRFLEDAVLTAIHIINRVPTKILQNKSPYEILFKRPHSFDHFKVFRCLCFVSTQTQHRKKFDSRANKCIFIGYPNHVKGYKVYDLRAQKVLVSKDVIFHEDTFPFHSSNHDRQDFAFHRTLVMLIVPFDTFDSNSANSHSFDQSHIELCPNVSSLVTEHPSISRNDKILHNSLSSS